MFRPTAIEFGALLQSKLQLRVALRVRQAFPKGNCELGAFAGGQFQQLSEICR